MNATRVPEFDLVVLGGGSGGLAGAFRAAQHGARVALVEPGELGGTCVNVGCVPKKAMWLASDLAGRIGLAARLGFALPSAPALDWPALVAARQGYIAGIHDIYRRRLDEAGVVRVAGRGRLLDARTVEADGGIRLRAGQVLLATGASARRPDVPGAALGGVSDDFFALCRPPGRVAILGGGYIAVELAGVLQGLGSRVDLFVRGDRLLPHADAELAARLRDDYLQQGIHAHMGYGFAGAVRDPDGRIRLRDDGGAAHAGYDMLLFAIGRAPNTAGIGLDAAGVALDGDGAVAVDAYQRTSAAGIHAVGDVTGRTMLTPVAIAAARRLMDRLFGGEPDARLDPSGIPSVVFSHPPLGMVGLTEAEARERHGDAVRIHQASFRPMLGALAGCPRRSLFKLVCLADGDAPAAQRVLGLHLLGEGADEILQGFAVALKKGLTLGDLHDTVAIHPTSAEEVVLMS